MTSTTDSDSKILISIASSSGTITRKTDDINSARDSFFNCNIDNSLPTGIHSESTISTHDNILVSSSDYEGILNDNKSNSDLPKHTIPCDKVLIGNILGNSDHKVDNSSGEGTYNLPYNKNSDGQLTYSSGLNKGDSECNFLNSDINSSTDNNHLSISDISNCNEPVGVNNNCNNYDNNLSNNDNFICNLPKNLTSDCNLPENVTSECNLLKNESYESNLLDNVTFNCTLPENVTSESNLPKIVNYESNLLDNVTYNCNLPENVTSECNLSNIYVDSKNVVGSSSNKDAKIFESNLDVNFSEIDIVEHKIGHLENLDGSHKSDLLSESSSLKNYGQNFLSDPCCPLEKTGNEPQQKNSSEQLPNVSNLNKIDDIVKAETSDLINHKINDLDNDESLPHSVELGKIDSFEKCDLSISIPDQCNSSEIVFKTDSYNDENRSGVDWVSRPVLQNTMHYSTDDFSSGNNVLGTSTSLSMQSAQENAELLDINRVSVHYNDDNISKRFPNTPVEYDLYQMSNSGLTDIVKPDLVENDSDVIGFNNLNASNLNQSEDDELSNILNDPGSVFIDFIQLITNCGITIDRLPDSVLNNINLKKKSDKKKSKRNISKTSNTLSKTELGKSTCSNTSRSCESGLSDFDNSNNSDLDDNSLNQPDLNRKNISKNNTNDIISSKYDISENNCNKKLTSQSCENQSEKKRTKSSKRKKFKDKNVSSKIRLGEPENLNKAKSGNSSKEKFVDLSSSNKSDVCDKNYNDKIEFRKRRDEVEIKSSSTYNSRDTNSIKKFNSSKSKQILLNRKINRSLSKSKNSGDFSKNKNDDLISNSLDKNDESISKKLNSSKSEQILLNRKINISKSKDGVEFSRSGNDDLISKKMDKNSELTSRKLKSKRNVKVSEALETRIGNSFDDETRARLGGKLSLEYMQSCSVVLERIEVPKNLFYYCFHCKYVTGSKELLQGHIETLHVKDPNYRCVLCNCKFKSKYFLELHKKKHEGKVQNPKRFQCPICSVKITQASGMKRHINYIHLQIKAYKCEICDRRFRERAPMMRHIRFVHNKEEKPYKCLQCEVSFEFKSELNTHYKVVHNNEKPYKCDDCAKSFGTIYTLKLHIRCCHSTVKPFACPHCEYRTGWRRSLKTHVDAVHLKLKKFKCHLCDYKATRMTLLRGHIDSVHLNKFKYPCDLCGAKFKQKSHLSTHFKRHNNTSKKIKCPIESCEFGAIFQSILDIHYQEVHLGIKNCLCPYCGSKFSRTHLLLQHVRSHHKTKLKYNCNYCEFSSHVRKYIKSHFSRKHPVTFNGEAIS